MDCGLVCSVCGHWSAGTLATLAATNDPPLWGEEVTIWAEEKDDPPPWKGGRKGVIIASFECELKIHCTRDKKTDVTRGQHHRTPVESLINILRMLDSLRFHSEIPSCNRPGARLARACEPRLQGHRPGPVSYWPLIGYWPQIPTSDWLRMGWSLDHAMLAIIW